MQFSYLRTILIAPVSPSGDRNRRIEEIEEIETRWADIIDVDVDVDRMVIISMMVMCTAIAIIEYDGRISGLPNAPLDMEYDNSSIELQS